MYTLEEINQAIDNCTSTSELAEVGSIATYLHNHGVLPGVIWQVRMKIEIYKSGLK